MSIFFNAMGEDGDSIRQLMGAEARDSRGRSSSASSSPGIRYVPLSRFEMMKIEAYYSFQEPEIDNINEIKNFYSIAAGSVKYYYGGKELDDREFGISETMRHLMIKARDGFIKFGFFAVRNPDAQAERLLVDMRNDSGGADNDSRNALSTPIAILEEARALIDELNAQAADNNPDVVDKEDAAVLRRKLKRLHANLDGYAAQDDDDDEPLDTRARALGGDQKRRRVPQKRRILNIETMPRTSWLKAPDAVLNVTADVPLRRNYVAGSSDALELFTPQTGINSEREQGLTLNDAIVGLNQLQPVDINEGQFYLEIDDLTNSRRVVFSRDMCDGSDFKLSTFKFGNRNAVNAAKLAEREILTPRNALRIDPEVTVHVFSGHMPDDSGMLRTKIPTVMRLYDAMNQAERNAAAVDYRNAHPIQIVQHIPTPYKKDVDRMTDQELYGGQESIEEEHQRRIEDTNQAVMTYALAMQAQIQNNKRRDDLARAIAEFAVAPVQLDAEGNPVPPRIERDDYFLLPAGCQTTSGVVATTTIDPNMMADRYRKALANALGIPLPLLDGGASFTGKATKGGQGSSTSSSSTGAAEIGHNRLKETISSDRDRLKEFVNGLWDAMYRQYDNKTLKNILSNETTVTRQKAEYKRAFVRRLLHRLAVVTEVDEITSIYSTLESERQSIDALTVRMRDIVRRIRQISLMRHRFEVGFENLSFLSQPELESAVNIGAITAYEAANAVRVGIGLPPFTEEEFQSNADAKLQTQADELEMQAQIQAKYDVKKTPGAGGASKAKKKPKK